MCQTPFYQTLNKLEHQFLNIKRTWTCSSFGNWSWTLYSWLRLYEHQTSNIVRPITILQYQIWIGKKYYWICSKALFPKAFLWVLFAYQAFCNLLSHVSPLQILGLTLTLDYFDQTGPNMVLCLWNISEKFRLL